MTAKGVALVTGSSQGIGKAIALRLADDGFDVAINDIPSGKDNLQRVSDEIASKGRNVLICIANVSVDKEVKEMVEYVVNHLGRLDVMVANAGICTASSLLDLDVNDWDHLMSINSRGVFLCYKYAAKQMIAQGGKGRLVGASSVVGKQGHAGVAAYSASKFAVRGLTHSAALELGKHGITVNAYAPGAIDTPMLAAAATKFATESGGDMYASEANLSAVGYLGKPNDIASLVSYLASPEAHFITGQTISVDGGRNPD
ncbi:hypothetical protein BDQ12DRAFT_637590 [Crucibulum laeve]|uniref:Acetoin reductase family protein n=1 Tax=Crucibulum laeve TaxID=68775 RepID=A0A5C3LN22_9AGAR|nr:hypothetical protein BDQ12DRAFT_637590 [Crucibulum laeve]